MGAGKTIESLAVLETLNKRHNLIVAKKRFIPEWFWQITKWLGADCLTPNENGDRLDGLDLLGPRFVAVNYDLLSVPRYFQALRKVSWDSITYDECHKLKNHETKRTRNAYQVSMRVPYISLVSGTPMQNSPADYFPYFHIIDPVKYSSYRDWTNYFCVWDEEEIWMKNSFGKSQSRIIRRIVPGETNHTKELGALLSLYMIRHERSEIFTQLPPKQYRQVPIELGTELKQYRQMEQEYFAILDSGEEITAPKAIAQMMRLRQVCCEPNLMSNELDPKPLTPSAKTATLLELIEDLEGKVVIFSYFEGYIRALCSELDKRKVRYVTLTGKTKYAGQDKLFQSDPSIKVCLGTIGAMGESYTLSEAETVVFCDLWWNPAINEQCEDRVYGRVDKGLDIKRGALIIDLYCQNTVEEHVHEVVRNKTDMINETLIAREVAVRMRRAK